MCTLTAFLEASFGGQDRQNLVDRVLEVLKHSGVTGDVRISRLPSGVNFRFDTEVAMTKLKEAMAEAAEQTPRLRKVYFTGTELEEELS